MPKKHKGETIWQKNRGENYKFDLESFPENSRYTGMNYFNASQRFVYSFTGLYLHIIIIMTGNSIQLFFRIFFSPNNRMDLTLISRIFEEFKISLALVALLFIQKSVTEKKKMKSDSSGLYNHHIELSFTRMNFQPP